MVNKLDTINQSKFWNNEKISFDVMILKIVYTQIKIIWLVRPNIDHCGPSHKTQWI
jgi:hypothetical protein